MGRFCRSTKNKAARADLEDMGTKFGLSGGVEFPARGEWSARAGDGSTEGTMFLTISRDILSY
jgi:hypothetical protein